MLPKVQSSANKARSLFPSLATAGLRKRNVRMQIMLNTHVKPCMLTCLVLAYLDLREDAGETFIDAFRRLGEAAFKAALYPEEAKTNAA